MIFFSIYYSQIQYIQLSKMFHHLVYVNASIKNYDETPNYLRDLNTLLDT